MNRNSFNPLSREATQEFTKGGRIHKKLINAQSAIAFNCACV